MRATKRGSVELRASVAILAALLLSACSNDATAPSKPGAAPAQITALPRALTSGETQLRDASNAFSFALLSKINAAQPNDNVFISPLSASFALGMTMNGAANETFSQMRSALQLGTMTQSDINANYRSLVALLLSLDSSTTVKIANSIFYANTYPFSQAFFDTTSKYFGATVKGLDFNNKPSTLSTINDWASTATNKKIPTVLDDYDPAMVLFLLNAIYFKGSWRNQFDAAQTASSPFTPLAGAVQTAAMMHRQDDMLYTETVTYQAIDLPYGNGAYSMTVVLPKAGNDINTVGNSFTASTWQTMCNSFDTHPANLYLPRLKLSYQRVLNDQLKALGMQAPFQDGVADFSRMTNSVNNLLISFVKQNAFVDINEEGTEAAAVTVVGALPASAPIAVEMRVNRPYLFAIREKLSGTVLFVGKIARMP